MLPVILLILPLLGQINGQTNREYWIHLYADKDYKNGISIRHKNILRCVDLGPDWQNRVSSLNTNDNCYMLFDQLGCRGNLIYAYKRGPDLSNLEARRFNDVMKSYKLCELDDSFGNKQLPLDRRSLHRNRPERGFWQYIFERFSSAFRRAFDGRATLPNGNARDRITWDFLPDVSGRPGQQYQGAINWVRRVVAAQNFDLGELREIRRRAWDVFMDRADRNIAAHPWSAGSANDAIHVQIEIEWEAMVRIIDAAINQAERELRK